MARKDFDIFQVFDFRRGLDVRTSPLTLSLAKGQNSLTKASNCVYNSSGAVSSRYDTTKLTNSSLGASVRITGGWQFVKSDGTAKDVFGTDGGKLYTLNSDGTTTQIGTGFTTGTKWWFETYNDKLLIGNRADSPQKYDGTTLGALGGTPPAKGGPVKRNGNRIFWLDATNKSRLTWSALNSEEDYTTASNAGSFDVSLNDGTDCVDLVPSINELLILKGARPYRLQGTSPSTFTLPNLVPSTGSVGAVSNQASFFAVNDVYYAAVNGLAKLQPVVIFGDLQQSYVSTNVKPYFEPDTSYTLSLQNLSACVAAYDPQWNRAYLAVDTDGDGKNDLVLVYDLVLKCWSTWGSLGICSMWLHKNSTTGVSEIYAGGYDGHVRVLNRNVSTNAFTSEARHLSSLNSPGVEKTLRHLFLYLKEQGNYAVTVDTKFDFGKSGGQTYTASLLGNSHTLGVSWVLGEDPLGSQTQVVKRLDTSGLGEFVEVGVKTLGPGQPFTWYGYEALSRSKRLVRRGLGAM